MSDILKVSHLHKIYNANKNNEFIALKDINFTLKESEIMLIKGVSGSGKSTLLSIIAAITKPTSGSIEFYGNNIAKMHDEHLSKYRNSHVGFIFQSFNLISELSVQENILAPLVLRKDLSKDEQLSKIQKAMQIANISHKANKKAFTLSGGEKQRCAIARALVNDPKLILADEPTANLDRENSLTFINILKEFKNLGKSVLIATHDDIFDTLDFVDKSIFLSHGQMKA